MGGWIKLYRDIIENPLWSARPFSKGQAWIDLVLRANYSDNQILIGNKLENVERGSLITSELKLMERWGWSKNKVRLFLKYLETENMIVKQSNQKRTAITVVNYSVYQDLQTTNEPPKDCKRTTKEPLTDCERTINEPPLNHECTANGLPMVHEQEIKEGKEKKKGKKEKVNGESMMEMFERLSINVQLSKPLSDKIQEWLKYKSERKEPYKEQGMKSLLTLITKHAQVAGDNTVMELIDECMASGWRGIIWDRLKLKSNRNNSHSDNKSIYHDQVTKLINEQQTGYEEDEDLPEVMY